MYIIIRADASDAIGSGHVMRCLTLAGERRKAGDTVSFVSRALPGHLIDFIEQKGFACHRLPLHDKNSTLTGYAAWLTVSQETDAAETIAMLHKLPPIDWLVVDSYAVDETWERMLRAHTQHIMVIDDLANRRHDCDRLLDQNFYTDMRHRYDGIVPQGCELLLGPHHALLREEFYEARRHLKKRDGTVRHVLVFYGGSDLTDETKKAIRALLTLDDPKITADIVVGASNPYRKEIEALCAQHTWMTYHCQVANMAEMMNRADLMLGAGGTTTWERLFLGLPAIVTAVAENQVRICEDCASAGLIEYAGKASDVTVEHLVRALRDLSPERCRTLSNQGYEVMRHA